MGRTTHHSHWQQVRTPAGHWRLNYIGSGNLRFSSGHDPERFWNCRKRNYRSEENWCSRCTRTVINIGIRTYCRWHVQLSGRIWRAPSSARGHLSLLGQRHVINQPSSPSDSFLLSRAVDDKWPESGRVTRNELQWVISMGGWGMRWPSANINVQDEGYREQRGRTTSGIRSGWCYE